MYLFPTAHCRKSTTIAEEGVTWRGMRMRSSHWVANEFLSLLHSMPRNHLWQVATLAEAVLPGAQFSVAAAVFECPPRACLLRTNGLSLCMLPCHLLDT